MFSNQEWSTIDDKQIGVIEEKKETIDHEIIRIKRFYLELKNVKQLKDEKKNISEFVLCLCKTNILIFAHINKSFSSFFP